LPKTQVFVAAGATTHFFSDHTVANKSFAMLSFAFFSIFLSLFGASWAWSPNGTSESDYIMGINLGSYFIIEEWMMWQYVGCNAPGVNDTWGLQSMSNAEQIMINHLDNYIREIDFQDAQARGVNFVRIPIAFWMFIPTQGDEPYWTDSRQKDSYLRQLVDWAVKYKMEVLLDIHALPGSQNLNDHSGRNLEIAGLTPQFLNSTNLARGNDTVDAIIEWVQALPNNLSSAIAMIELANEPQISMTGAYDALVGYYVANQAKIAEKLPNVWTVIADAWLGVQSWGDVFNPSQKVILDLHWWNLFTDIPSLTVLEDTYCSLPPASSPHAWNNPIIIGEFSGNENGINFTHGETDEERLQFYQLLYASQLWAARGSDGRLPQYRGAFVWSMKCTNCADVWQPYWMSGQSDTLAITAPNWCNSSQTTPTSPNQGKINSSPERDYDKCGVYNDRVSATTSSGSSTSNTASGAIASVSKTSAANAMRWVSRDKAFSLLTCLVALLVVL
jgi:glucan 1,3-beta-glucosidase